MHSKWWCGITFVLAFSVAGGTVNPVSGATKNNKKTAPELSRAALLKAPAIQSAVLASFEQPQNARAILMPVLGAELANDRAANALDARAKAKQTQKRLRNDLLGQQVTAVSAARGTVTVQWCALTVMDTFVAGEPTGGFSEGSAGTVTFETGSTGLVPQAVSVDPSPCAAAKSDKRIEPLLIELIARFNEADRKTQRQPELAPTLMPSVLTGNALESSLQANAEAVKKKLTWVGTDAEWKLLSTGVSQNAVLIADGLLQVTFCREVGGYITENGTTIPETVGVEQTESIGTAVLVGGKWLLVNVGDTDTKNCARPASKKKKANK